MNKNVY